MTPVIENEEQAQKLLAALTKYYGERVAPASKHCEALYEWVRVMKESGYAPQVAEALSMIHITLLKSNLAARLVYGGEKLRTEKCPKHNGHWSGCSWGGDSCPEGCMWGSNVTGWLPEPHRFVEPPPLTEGSAKVHAKLWPDFDPSLSCYKCGGALGAAIHD